MKLSELDWAHILCVTSFYRRSKWNHRNKHNAFGTYSHHFVMETISSNRQCHVGTKNVASKTTDTVVDGTKSAVNTTVETTGKVVHNVWDGTKSTASTIADGTKSAASNVVEGTKNLAAAGAEKSSQAWEGIGYRKQFQCARVWLRRMFWTWMVLNFRQCLSKRVCFKIISDLSRVLDWHFGISFKFGSNQTIVCKSHCVYLCAKK